ncbi:MAG: phosphoenolpyruvate--protein phosphotransferase [Rubripirellula sp.]
MSTLVDICELILQSHDLDQTLANIVHLVASRMRTEVCSIYLLEGSELQLRATEGLATDSIGHVTLQLGEGLVGHTGQLGEVVNVPEPQQHPRFRYFAESNEEQFHSFLGIPLNDRKKLIGVMAIQTVERRDFQPIEIDTLTTIAFQLSTVISNARLLDSLDRNSEPPFPADMASPRECQPVLRGDVLQAGVASAPAFVIDEAFGVSEVVDDDPCEDPEIERDRLDGALEKTRVETICLEKRVANQLSDADAAIFHSHLMILQDHSFLEKLDQQISLGRSASQAVKTVVSQYVEAFRALDDPYLRERSVDMEDIGKRILTSLCGSGANKIVLTHPCILVAQDLMPSEIAALDFQWLRGIVLETSQSNGHAAIVAKSMGIPTLVGVSGAVQRIEPGAPLILDTNSGCLYVEPETRVKQEYQRLQQDSMLKQEQLQVYMDRPPATQDGEAICLRANIGIFSDVDVARRNQASGVGLYRTEFPFMMRSSLPTREDQYQLYRRVVESFEGEQVTIRTLDIGGDKHLPYLGFSKEENPALGRRSVRFSLDHPDLFRTQIEAILMASTHGPVRLLFPMVTKIDELRACRQVVQECRDKLTEEGWVLPQVPLGIMIEVPAAIAIADHLAREADFFALGTNDLIQYLLAADRGNATVRDYYEPMHPAVLQSIARMVDVSKRTGRELCLCGEMASDPGYLALLVGLGLREFSVAAPGILRLKATLAQSSLSDLQNLAEGALELGDSQQIRDLIDRTIQFPD